MTLWHLISIICLKNNPILSVSCFAPALGWDGFDITKDILLGPESYQMIHAWCKGSPSVGRAPLPVHALFSRHCIVDFRGSFLGFSWLYLWFVYTMQASRGVCMWTCEAFDGSDGSVGAQKSGKCKGMLPICISEMTCWCFWKENHGNWWNYMQIPQKILCDNV